MSTIWSDIKSTIENASTNPISAANPLAGLALSIDNKAAPAVAHVAGKVVKGTAKGILHEIVHYAPNLIMIIAGLVLVFYAIKSSGAVGTSINITEMMGGGDKKETAKVPVEKTAKEGAKKTAKEGAKKTAKEAATTTAETAAEVAVA